MNRCEIRFCPQCGADGVGTREITPSYFFELCCPHCGFIATLQRQEHELVGTTAARDPDSDTEAW